MLFNSLPFILGFLPVVLCGYWALGSYKNARLWFLLLASVAFYGFWNVRDVPLLLLTIVANWLAAGVYARGRRKAVAILSITGNLLVLGIYKYLSFFVGILDGVVGVNLKVDPPRLPLGISFFTFHHIIYWVDLWRKDAPFYRLRDYALYIANFPQILAGPLVRNREIIPQYALDLRREGWEERFGRGIVLFSIGLAKKVLLADPLSMTTTQVFGKAGLQPVPMLEAWNGALSFTFQIYFDFSGYSDMAIGLALMLGMVLPINFDIPYRATSIRDFWRRWHMTLSRFLRDYLYIAFGGNRHGLPRQVLALLATMALGGLWHGAGWTFVLWGLAHGAGLAIDLLWRRWFWPLPRPVGWALTLVFVATTWVLFRATSIDAAGALFGSMFGRGDIGSFGPWRALVPAALVAVIGPSSWQAAMGLRPRRSWAAFAAIAMVLLVFKMGGQEAYEFIYFKF